MNALGLVSPRLCPRAVRFNGVFWLGSNRYFSRTEFLKTAIGSRYSKIEKAYRLIRNSRLIHTIRADTVARLSARDAQNTKGTAHDSN